MIAAGGPGELYRDSVYPKQCFGALGMALEAGIEAVNLTESQFGIGTSRDGFPWNLSGTYVQAMPHIFSLDATGASAISSATITGRRRSWRRTSFARAISGLSTRPACSSSDRASSISRSFASAWPGGAVFMDFNRDPAPAKGGEPFSLDRLDADVRTYLGRSGALIESPIARLSKMNPLSIELYRRYKKDITRDPLEFAVNNQHMNGGLAVNVWGETNLERCYAVGEAAGTHGVTRPGGAALNLGPGFRRARSRTHRGDRPAEAQATAPPRSLLEAGVADALGVIRAGGPAFAAESSSGRSRRA